jgi:hypothetical protein
VNVIGHHFQGGNRSLQLGRFLFKKFSQAFFDGVYQNPAAIIRAPNQVKLERVERAAILCVPGNNHRSGIIQLTDNKSLRKRQFHRQLKQAVALPS